MQYKGKKGITYIEFRDERGYGMEGQREVGAENVGEVCHEVTSRRLQRRVVLCLVFHHPSLDLADKVPFVP